MAFSKIEVSSQLELLLHVQFNKIFGEGMDKEPKDLLFGFLLRQLALEGANLEKTYSMIANNNFGSLSETVSALKFITKSKVAEAHIRNSAMIILLKLFNENKIKPMELT